MDTAVAIALIAGVVTAVGWFVDAALTTRRDQRARTVAAVLAHTERQLERLYGPLEFLLIEGGQAFQDLLDDLGRTWVFPPSGPIPEDELRRWLFFLEHSGLPLNERIRELLAQNTHLIEGERMPESFRAFIEYYTSWKLDHLRWQAEGVEYAWHAKSNFPPDFEGYVETTFLALMRRRAALLREASRLNGGTSVEESATLQRSAHA